MQYKHLVSIFLGSVVLTTQAQTESLPEEITISASRIERPLQEVGVSVDVLDAEQIRAQGAFSLADALRTVPGLSVSNSGGLGKQTTLRIRGEEGYRTKVLLNGIEISDSSSTQIQPQLEHYLSAGVERIEVLRGPQGMMYGADAGGVVNIITRRAEAGFNGGVSAEYGSYESKQLDAFIAGKNNDFDYSLQATTLDSEGFNTSVDDTVLQDDDGYDNTTLGLNLGYQFNEAWRLDGGLLRIDSETEFDGCFGTLGATHDCASTFEQDNLRLSLAYENEAFTQRLSWHDSATDRLSFSDGTAELETEGELTQVLYLGSYAFTENKRLVFGADFQEAELDDRQNPYERGQDAVFAEWQSTLGSSFYYTLGLRRDDNEDFGIHNSYRVSAAYLIDLVDAQLKLKSSAGNGFRAPSLYEIAYNRSAFASPPASTGSLVEENSRGFDAGFEYVSDSGREFEAVYFNQQISDVIEFDLAGFSGYVQRVGQSKARGVELAAAQPLSASFSLRANYTYTDTEDSMGRQRIRRPEHTALLALSYLSENERLRSQLSVQHSANTVDEYYDALLFTNVRTSLEDYTLVNLSAAYDVAENVSLFGRITNLFDEDYVEVFNYNTSGRAFYAGVRLSF